MLTWTDWVGFFAGQGAASPEDDPTEGDDMYKDIHRDIVTNGAFGVIGWANSASEHTHHYTVRVTGYKSEKNPEKFATIELQDNDLAQILIDNAGGYYDVCHCADNGKEFNTYTRFNFSESRKNDQYLYYLYMRNGTMYGQGKKYSGETIQAKKKHAFRDDEVIGIHNYGTVPLGSKSLEDLIMSELQKPKYNILIYSN